jgi:hypothetical protein
MWNFEGRKTMATRKQALAAIAKQGGTVDWDVSYITTHDKHICVDAPDGLMWDSSQSESFVINWYSGSASEFWDEVIDMAEAGAA